MSHHTTARLLEKYSYLWLRQPLWLTNWPGLPDARQHPGRAVAAAQALLDSHRISYSY